MKAPSCDVPPNFNVSQYDPTEINLVCNILYDFVYPDHFNRDEHARLLNHALEYTEYPCEDVQDLYHLCFWCDEAILDEAKKGGNDYCTFDYFSMQNPGVCTPETTIPWDNQTLAEETCLSMEEAREFYLLAPLTSDSCHEAHDVLDAGACPNYCDDAPKNFSYDNIYIKLSPTQKLKIAWYTRFSAILSLLGACYVLYDILSSPRNRKTVYHRLVGAMTVFDVTSAVVWTMSTAVHPSMGTSFRICKVQGTNGGLS